MPFYIKDDGFIIENTKNNDIRVFFKMNDEVDPNLYNKISIDIMVNNVNTKKKRG